jgi:hypothetical protein
MTSESEPPRGASTPASITRFGRADLQVHTAYGDGMATATELFDLIETTTDLDVIAVTDHDDVGGALEAREAHARGHYSFELVTGIEVTTVHGHLLALWVDRPIPSFKSVEATIAAIHAAGGLAVVPHPFSMLTRSIGRRTLDRVMRLPDADQRPDGLEVANTLSKGWHAGDAARAANASRWRLPETGGSDAHFAEAIGRAYTRFPGATAEELNQALRAGQTEGVLLGGTPYREIGPSKLVRQQVRGLAVTPRKVLGPRVSALVARGRSRIGR